MAGEESPAINMIQLFSDIFSVLSGKSGPVCLFEVPGDRLQVGSQGGHQLGDTLRQGGFMFCPGRQVLVLRFAFPLVGHGGDIALDPVGQVGSFVSVRLNLVRIITQCIGAQFNACHGVFLLVLFYFQPLCEVY